MKDVCHCFGLKERFETVTGYWNLRAPCGVVLPRGEFDRAGRFQVGPDRSSYVHRITCGACLIAIDALLEAGVLKVCDSCPKIHIEPRYEPVSLDVECEAIAIARQFWDAADAAGRFA